MPTLTRFVTILIICAAIVYAAAFVLANFVQPTRVEERIELPIQELLEQAERRENASRPPTTALPDADEAADTAGDQDDTQ
ncbi:hypothetical protein [Notoacmeibacter sp. MSK16QG-6]|uniref:hypothetical protein n=1 Tax=Notoacmeibacter sp. MSK16QG-6 TaxID=2957982 RepID=UPI00209F7716|nr:hypothetical protein [Notoacmeibacter sp. MSK16QG-6]MCP1200011.1 hypothetical protein [Notoacmeibacter sp. MSK16QG-6]